MTNRTTTRKPSHIPEFSSIEDEAQWWDTHSIADYLDELEPVEVRFAKHLSGPMAVRLSAADRAEVSRRAEAKGIGPSTLIRMWVKERLQQEDDKVTA